MERKYELMEESKRFLIIGEYDDVTTTVYRIRALKDFGNVKKGDLGGWIESENNLSHEGNCWVYDNARVCGHAKISGNANVKDNAMVFGWATINCGAFVYDNARVWGGAIVSDTASVSGKAAVYGNTTIYGYCKIRGFAEISGNAKIANVIIDQDVQIHGSTMINAVNEYVIIGPIGSRRANTVFTRLKEPPYIYVCTGCFHGDINAFKKAVIYRHGNRTRYGKEYLDAIKYAKRLFKTRRKDEKQ